jgi:hypothetical protein
VHRASRPAALAATIAAALTACGGDRDVGPITDPDSDWPASILELGASDAGGAWSPDDGLAYEVAHPLWSGGTAKRRHLLVPDGAAIDAGERGRWRFAPGTVAFKTFLDGERPLETRALRRLESGWEYAAYLWSDDGEDAELLPLDEPVAIELGDGGVHTVPVMSQCRECHAVGDSPMLGVRELQLSAAPAAGGSGGSQLERLDALGLLAGGAPEEPDAVEHPDPTTASVLGWFVGNCAHCHDGSGREGTSFDLSPGAALASTVGQPTESSASAAGIRIVPGAPAESILYLAVSGEHDDPEIRDMPPVGVDKRDREGVAALRRMIEELAP